MYNYTCICIRIVEAGCIRETHAEAKSAKAAQDCFPRQTGLKITDYSSSEQS